MNNSNRIPVVIVVATRMTKDEMLIIKNKGYRIVFLKNDINEEEMMMFDFPFEVDLNDEDKTFELIQKLTDKFNVMRVITFNEYYVALVAQIAERFNIPYWGLSIEGALNCRHKKNTKKVFQENNIPSAKHVIIQSPGEVLSVLRHFDFPIVVKPSNDSGSHNVYICRTIQELIDGVNKIYTEKNNLIGQVIDKDVIVEEYLEGPEFSIETITIRGESNIVAITAKETLNAIEVSHTVPALLAKEDTEDIKAIVKKALKVLKIDYGITHTEIKLTIDGPKIIEVNGRIGGDNIDEIVKYVTGVDLRKTAILIALDGDEASISCSKIESNSATVYFIVTDNSGVVNINIKDEIIESKYIKGINLYVENGQQVKTATCNVDRLGHLVVIGDDNKYSREIAETISKGIELKIT